MAYSKILCECTNGGTGGSRSRWVVVAGGGGLGACSLASLISPAATTDGDVAEGTAPSPVSPASLAEVARLAEAVVVEVAELGVAGVAPWAF